MFEKLVSTKEDYGALVARLALGIMIFPHGAQKLLGWFGGNGFGPTMDWFTQQLGIPWIFGFLAIMAEFFGGLGLIVGFMSRIAALGVGITMLVAVMKVHAANGFFMNWYVIPERGHGYEFHILAIGLALVAVLKGGGALSVDRVLTKK